MLRSRISSKCTENSLLKRCLTVTTSTALLHRSTGRRDTAICDSYTGQGVPRCSVRRNYTQAVLPRSEAQKKTIYALATPPGRGGVGVVRISGPDALEVWRRMVKPHGRKHTTPEPWKLGRCRIVHPTTGATLDDALVVYFQSPKSFTSEDTLELHIHSGRAIISAVLSALSLLPTLRSAEPGEFTRRAFLSGRLDLTQVEGLKDLIDAETEGQRRVAVRAAEGEVRKRLEDLRKGVVGALAKVEALIDFGEGEEIEEGVYEGARQDVEHVLKTVEGYLNDHRRGELLRSGIKLAIFGPPNAGKSSLLNFLAQREAAIVTPVAGTTRDVLELSLDIAGLPVIISDTAGLRKTEDVVEMIGIERARQAVHNADISLCVLSLQDIFDKSQPLQQRPSPDISQCTGQQRQVHTWHDLVSPKTYFLFNKSDLVPSDFISPPGLKKLYEAAVSSSTSSAIKDPENIGHNQGRVLSGPEDWSEKAWSASLGTGEGAEEFLRGFGEALKKRYGLDDASEASSDTPVLITRTRHRDHLQAATMHLALFLEYGPNDVVFAAEELRYAAHAIGKVTGAIGVEDVLDAVFRDFCIGK